MSYQPLDWDIISLLQMKKDKIDTISLFNSMNLSSVERFTFDRSIVISQFLLDKGLKRPSVLDLGSSGGVFALTFKIILDAHVTAIDDDRYILIQGETESSSIKMMKNRLKRLNIQGIIPINTSIEEYIGNLPPIPLYDSVLLLNILHHFYTGYGQGSSYGQMDFEETSQLLRKIGAITSKYLFFEINSSVIKDYEQYLTDIMYICNFRKLEYVTRSVATDGSLRAIWCFIK
ncbi:hypothetical protein [Paenibacillus sp. WC2504]|uniref:hypothetical protein n=1 Tax=Paenibacillus sp. WC2504 TaxID=3461403 RepID=UPI0040458F12